MLAWCLRSHVKDLAAGDIRVEAEAVRYAPSTRLSASATRVDLCLFACKGDGSKLHGRHVS